MPIRLAWSPDGKYIAYDTPSQEDIWLVEIETGNITNLTKEFDGIAVYPRWGDDDTLFFATQQSEQVDVWMLKLDTSELANLTSEIDADIESLVVVKW